MNTVGCVDIKLQTRLNFAHKNTDRQTDGQTQKTILSISFDSWP